MTIPASTWWRVHRYDSTTGLHDCVSFNRSGLGNARFSPLLEGDPQQVIGTLYAADTLAGALMETVFHEVPWPSAGHSVDLTKHLASSMCASRIVCTASLRLADLTSVGLRPLGLAQADLIDTNADHYPRTRACARWFHDSLPQCQGLIWMSRQDNSARAIMLFEDRAGAAGMLRRGRDLHQPLHAPAVLDVILELMERLQLGDSGP